MSETNSTEWDVARALAEAGKHLDRVEARILLRYVTGMTAAEVATYPERRLTPVWRENFRALVARREGGEPIAYLTGMREFYGRNFIVTPDVLVPRPETELLVDVGLGRMASVLAPRILDLGSGSGCVAVSLSLERPGANVTAADKSAAALAVARRNAASHGATLRCVESDWYAALAGTHYHLIVANPPYIAAGDPHLAQGDLRFEPESALVGGSDGLADMRIIVAQAPAHLLPGGWLLLEHGYDQAQAVHELLSSAGFVDIGQYRDLAGIIRVSGGRLTA
jgi:release factor glutamine methyltransferase